MTTAEMLATLKTRLDDGFWTDTELYQALTNGQREVVLYLSKTLKYAKDYIERATKNFVSDGEVIMTTRPILSARYAYDGTDYYNCRILNVADVVSVQANTFLEPDEYDPVLYQDDEEVTILPSPAGGKSKIEYVTLKAIDPIDATHEPTLDERTHNAIVQWAYAEVLSKDESRAGESENEKKIFYEILRAV